MNVKQAVKVAIKYMSREEKKLALSAMHYDDDPVFWSGKRGAWERHKEIIEAMEVLEAVAAQGKLF